jgi:hypothetical protein
VTVVRLVAASEGWTTPDRRFRAVKDGFTGRTSRWRVVDRESRQFVRVEGFPTVRTVIQEPWSASSSSYVIRPSFRSQPGGGPRLRLGPRGGTKQPDEARGGRVADPGKVTGPENLLVARLSQRPHDRSSLVFTLVREGLCPRQDSNLRPRDSEGMPRDGAAELRGHSRRLLDVRH